MVEGTAAPRHSGGGKWVLGRYGGAQGQAGTPNPCCQLWGWGCQCRGHLPWGSPLQTGQQDHPPPPRVEVAGAGGGW